jgi:cytoskeletal protein CcmA (bactofilin family)
MDTPKTLDSARTDLANIGKSVVIKGELSGSEDLYLDGQVEGSIEMAGNRLTIGPNGKVKANVTARSAVVQGRLEGNVRASDRVDLKQSAIVLGDIATQRISIEEGAYFKGGVDIQREASKTPPKPEISQARPDVKADARPSAAAATSTGSGPSVTTSNAASLTREPGKA